MRLRELNKAMTAIENVVRLKKPKRGQGGYDEKNDEPIVDNGVLLLLTGAMLEYIRESQEQEESTASLLIQRFRDVLGNLGAMVSGCWAVWAAQAQLFKALGDDELVIMAREKQSR